MAGRQNRWHSFFFAYSGASRIPRRRICAGHKQKVKQGHGYRSGAYAQRISTKPRRWPDSEAAHMRGA